MKKVTRTESLFFRADHRTETIRCLSDVINKFLEKQGDDFEVVDIKTLSVFNSNGVTSVDKALLIYKDII